MQLCSAVPTPGMISTHPESTGIFFSGVSFACLNDSKLLSLCFVFFMLSLTVNLGSSLSFQMHRDEFCAKGNRIKHLYGWEVPTVLTAIEVADDSISSDKAVTNTDVSPAH